LYIEQDHRQIENEYLIHQQAMLSRSTAFNEMLSFKKELERSERQREQFSDRLEVNFHLPKNSSFDISNLVGNESIE
jgi:hypothetical protein